MFKFEHTMKILFVKDEFVYQTGNVIKCKCAQQHRLINCLKFSNPTIKISSTYPKNSDADSIYMPCHLEFDKRIYEVVDKRNLDDEIEFELIDENAICSKYYANMKMFMAGDIQIGDNVYVCEKDDKSIIINSSLLDD